MSHIREQGVNHILNVDGGFEPDPCFVLAFLIIARVGASVWTKWAGKRDVPSDNVTCSLCTSHPPSTPSPDILSIFLLRKGVYSYVWRSGYSPAHSWARRGCRTGMMKYWLWTYPYCTWGHGIPIGTYLKKTQCPWPRHCDHVPGTMTGTTTINWCACHLSLH
jgi:hypothetical protein